VSVLRRCDARDQIGGRLRINMTSQQCFKTVSQSSRDNTSMRDSQTLARRVSIEDSDSCMESTRPEVEAWGAMY
jgi:hypothetical protein